MFLTIEDEKRFVLLLSIEDLGGAGTKNQILDNIEKQGYFKYDESYLKSRFELVWRNDLAFVRQHLVEDHYIDKSKRNWWKITTSGQAYFQKLRDIVANSNEIKFEKLTQQAISRAKSIEPNNSQLKQIESSVSVDLEILEQEEEHFEGKLYNRYINYYERDLKLRSKAILIHGTKCMVCGFNFEKIYGIHGKGFIEVHHLKPVSELKVDTKIDPKTDLVVVCSNCHRMLHRNRNNVLPLEELKKIIQIP